MKFLYRAPLLLPVVLLFVGCDSPEAKLNRAEAQEKAIEISSGYDACMKKIEDYNRKGAKCVSDVLAKKGYTDSIRCTTELFGGGSGSELPACSLTTTQGAQRNLAEAIADQDCLNRFTADEPALSEMDCRLMLTKAKQGQ
jgi:hypothetical protein